MVNYKDTNEWDKRDFDRLNKHRDMGLFDDRGGISDEQKRGMIQFWRQRLRRVNAKQGCAFSMQ